MDYIRAMKNLEKYREDKRDMTRKVTNAEAIATQTKQKAATSFNANNLIDQTKNLLVLSSDERTSGLSNYISYNCQALGMEYTEDIKRMTAEYERRMISIYQEAKEVIRKGTQKPLTQDAIRLMGVLMLGMFGIAMLAAASAVSSMMGPGDSSSMMCTLAGLGSLTGALAIITRKKKPDTNRLSALASDARMFTSNYFTYISSKMEEAYTGFKAKYDAELDGMESEIKAELGDRVLFLFENTPYMQQDYFISLGMTATSDEDFNVIAQECIKADKTQQQINLQNQINIDTRNAINKGIADLNRTAKQIHEDAEFRARQQAQHNAETARQNSQNLKNQAKTLDELKKQTARQEELEYKMRHMSDN